MGSRLRTNHLYRLSALRGVCACDGRVGGVVLPPAEGALWGLYRLKKWSRKDSSEGRVLCFHSGVSVGVGGRREEWPQHLLLSGVFNWWMSWLFLVFGMYIMFFYFVSLNWKYVNAIQSFSSFLIFFLPSRCFNIVLTASSKCVNLALVQIRCRLFIASQNALASFQWPTWILLKWAKIRSS